jgi:hypothetical protein
MGRALGPWASNSITDTVQRFAHVEGGVQSAVVLYAMQWRVKNNDRTTKFSIFGKSPVTRGPSR